MIQCAVLLFFLLGIFASTFPGSEASRLCRKYYLGRLENGIIKSPNFPFNYRNNLDCEYKIHLPHVPNTFNRTVCFQFHRFDLEPRYNDFENCQHDYVRFTELSFSYCGKGQLKRPTSHLGNVFSSEFCIPTRQGIFLIKFVSDTTLRRTGFYATYKLIIDRPSNKFSSTHLITGNTRTKRKFSGWKPRCGPCPPFNPWTQCPGYKFCFHGHVPDSCGCRTCKCNLAPTAPCHESNSTCFNRNCILTRSVCNGIDNCHDNSDEEWAHARCSPDAGKLKACDFEGTDGDSHCLVRKVGIHGGTWQRTNTYNQNGPPTDHTTGVIDGGYYMMTSFYGDFIDIGSIISFEGDFALKTGDISCLTFWYHMYRDQIGSLNLYVHEKDHGTSGNLSVWYREGNQGWQWLEGQVELPQTAFKSRNLVAKWSMKRGPLRDPKIGIDDISILKGKCSGGDISCTFELSSCQWTQGLYQDDFHWVRYKMNMSRPNEGAGPDNRGLGGWYMLAKASGNFGAKARLVSPPVSAAEEEEFCLRFWYFMMSTDRQYDRLTVLIAGEEEGAARKIWEKDQVYGNWHKDRVTIKADGPFQIVFEAFNGKTTSKPPIIAIDDIILIPGSCSNLPRPTPVPASTTSAARQCSGEEYQCANGHCIPTSGVCDGHNSCGDGSDEDIKQCRNHTGNSSGTPVGAIVGITLACVFVIILVVANICVCKNKLRQNRCQRSRRRRSPQGQRDRRQSRDQRSRRSPEPVRGQRSDSIRVSLTNRLMNDPPPPYTISGTDNTAYSGSMVTITFQQPREPPPSYDSLYSSGEGTINQQLTVQISTPVVGAQTTV